MSIRAAKDILLGGNLSSLSLLKTPLKLRRYAHAAFMLRKSFASTSLIPKPVTSLFPGSEDVQFAKVPPADDWFAKDPNFTLDILNLCALVRGLKPKTIFEIGTFHGYTTLHMAINSAADTRIFTLDLPPGKSDSTELQVNPLDHGVIDDRESVCLFSGHPAEKKITRLYGDSAKFDFSPYHGKVDLFFVDGAHSFEYAESDTRNAMRCIRRGGVIAWHDYGRPEFGVMKFLDRLAKTMPIHIVPGGSLAYARV